LLAGHIEQEARRVQETVRDKCFVEPLVNTMSIQSKRVGCASCGVVGPEKSWQPATGDETDNFTVVELTGNVLDAFVDHRVRPDPKYATRYSLVVDGAPTTHLCLYPRFVRDSHDDGTRRTPVEVSLCLRCSSKAVKGKAPAWSVASGFDFGLMDTFFQQYPANAQELLVLSRVRAFRKTLKISAAGTLEKFHGHVICFDQDMLLKLLERLHTGSVSGSKPLKLCDSLEVVFVGEMATWDKFRGRLVQKLRQVLRIRAPIVRAHAEAYVAMQPLQGSYLMPTKQTQLIKQQHLTRRHTSHAEGFLRRTSSQSRFSIVFWREEPEFGSSPRCFLLLRFSSSVGGFFSPERCQIGEQ
jgi:hypothetical protein